MSARETPVMKQHAAAKRAYPDAILFFRLGDFYEMFGEDAVVCAHELELTLTSRNKGKPDEIPMAGVPHHAAHGYISRLLEKGYKVAICEQMADPSKVKGIVPREVVRVITPGTVTDGEQLKPRINNWLCGVHLDTTGVGDKTGFLDEAAAAFGFPGWFGRNWDAFADSLGDVRAERGTLVLWDGSGDFAAANEEQLAVALEILRDRSESTLGGAFGVLVREEPGMLADDS